MNQKPKPPYIPTGSKVRVVQLNLTGALIDVETEDHLMGPIFWVELDGSFGATPYSREEIVSC
jgi:hypothetical protein